MSDCAVADAVPSNECSAPAFCAADASPGLDFQQILLESLGAAILQRLQEVLVASGVDTVQSHHVFQRVRDLVAELDARFAQPRGRQAVQKCVRQPLMSLLLQASDSTDPGAARLLADLIQRSSGAEENGKSSQAAARRQKDTVLRPDELPRFSCAMIFAGSSATPLMTVDSARQTYAKTPLNSPAISAHADLLLACLTRSEDPAVGFAATVAGLFKEVGHSSVGTGLLLFKLPWTVETGLMSLHKACVSTRDRVCFVHGAGHRLEGRNGMMPASNLASRASPETRLTTFSAERDDLSTDEVVVASAACAPAGVPAAASPAARPRHRGHTCCRASAAARKCVEQPVKLAKRGTGQDGRVTAAGCVRGKHPRSRGAHCLRVPHSWVMRFAGHCWLLTSAVVRLGQRCGRLILAPWRGGVLQGLARLEVLQGLARLEAVGSFPQVLGGLICGMGSSSFLSAAILPRLLGQLHKLVTDAAAGPHGATAAYACLRACLFSEALWGSAVEDSSADSDLAAPDGAIQAASELATHVFTLACKPQQVPLPSCCHWQF